MPRDVVSIQIDEDQVAEIGLKAIELAIHNLICEGPDEYGESTASALCDAHQYICDVYGWDRKFRTKGLRKDVNQFLVICKQLEEDE